MGLPVAAVRGYALTIFEHDRETAMQWLMTLPPDERRENTLRFILVNKLRDDPDAAAAFKDEKRNQVTHGTGKVSQRSITFLSGFCPGFPL